MTTLALTGGFAVCQARLGAKVHDPKDPGADLGPMFRQVVTTILRMAVANADRWATVKGSHDVPAYGFERVVDPPPLEVNVLRLLSEFHAGSLTLGATWARDALGRTPRRRSTASPRRPATWPTTSGTCSRSTRPGASDRRPRRWPTPRAGFTFPDAVWARVIYDLVVTAERHPDRLDAFVAALVPVYFGRVASFVIENRDLSTERAEESVERQAREFERLKPYLLNRWAQTVGTPA